MFVNQGKQKIPGKMVKLLLGATSSVSILLKFWPVEVCFIL